MAGMMSIGGLASGLKTDDIIAKIMEKARQPQNMMLQQKADAQMRLTAWQDLNTRMLALKAKGDGISSSNSFAGFTATSSNTDILSVSASSTASSGVYYISVSKRAQAHQLSSQVFNSLDDVVGTGKVKLNFTTDSSRSFEVTLDSANNTISGLRDAINKANKDVKASILNAGTSASPQYRLILTSAITGEASEFTVDTSALSGGTTPTLNQIVQQAQDAQLTFGQGAGAITVEKSNNIITDLIPGVTLNVTSADENKSVKVDITQDTTYVKTAIQGFVAQYNDLVDAMEKYSDYDTETSTGGALLGSFELSNVQQNIISAVTGTVVGVDSKFSSLSTVGITLDSSGHLNIDDADLTKALSDNMSEVTKLFSTNMQSESSYISYLSSGSETQPSGATGWSVDITQAARRAQVTAAIPMAGTLGQEETLTLNSSNGQAQFVKLTAGMTLDQVVTEVNKYSSKTGVSAVATGAGGSGSGSYLTLRSTRYGSASDITVFSNLSNGGSNTTGLGNVSATGANPGGETGTGIGFVGLDVQGTVNGEKCTGKGQLLTAEPEDKYSKIKGLSLQITASAPLNSKITFTKGVAAATRDLLVNMTSSKGSVTLVQESINTEISDYDDRIADMETRLLDYQDRMYEKFNMMESQLAKLQQQGNYLTSQLSAMNSGKK